MVLGGGGGARRRRRRRERGWDIYVYTERGRVGCGGGEEESSREKRNFEKEKGRGLWMTCKFFIPFLSPLQSMIKSKTAVCR